MAAQSDCVEQEPLLLEQDEHWQLEGRPMNFFARFDGGDPARSRGTVCS